ncbi:MAG TPA: hypothetical protein VFT64_09115 [Rickettsiales bacterium]|nr:hypothetical protein [Rickettsiales bacterium]
MKLIVHKILNNRLFIRLISLGDQVLFTGGNFLLTILFTRYYKDTELAAYGMAVSAALILQGVQRNSYVVQNSLLSAHVLMSRGRKVLAEQIVAVVPLLCLLAVLSVITWIFWPGSDFSLITTASTICFSIYAQLEFERMMLVKYKKIIIPFITSCIYVLLVTGLIFTHETFSFYEVMVILLVFTTLKSLIIIFIVGKPDFKGGWNYLRSDMRRNAISSLMGVIGYAGYMQAPVIILGIFCPQKVEVAAYVAMRGVMQPLALVIRSMDIIDKSYFHEKSTGTGGNIRKVMNAQIMLYGAVSLVLSLGISIFGKPIVQLLYHGKYLEYTNNIYFWGVITVFFAILQPLESVIIIYKQLPRYNIIRLWIGIGTCLLVCLTAKPFGALGAVFVSMLASIAGAAAAILTAHKYLKNT